MQVTHDSLSKTISTTKTFRIGRRFSGAATNGLEIDELRMYSRVLHSGEIERLGYIESIHPLLEGKSKKLNPAERNLLVNYYLNRHDPSYKKVQAVLAGKRKALNDLKNQ